MDKPSPLNQRAPFAWRAMTSVLITVSFVILVLSGGMLFVSPPGRIANWTNWNILSLTKRDWIALHICFGTLFLVVSIFHLAFNWRPLVSYFKNRLTLQFGFRWEWLVALVICGAVYAGTRLNVPPFSTLLTFNEQVKASWDNPRERAPIPHAELLTLSDLAQKAGVDMATVTNRLKAKGITGCSAHIIVQQLAEKNRISSQQLYELILAEPARNEMGRGQGPGGSRGRGAGTGGGMGFKTLTQFCADEGIALTNALSRLQAKGIKASSDQTLREIAVNNGYSRPYEILVILREQ